MCVEDGSIWAVQVEGTAAAAGLSIVISTSALDESLGVVVVWEQATWVTVAFAITWVCRKERSLLKEVLPISTLSCPHDLN